MEFIRLKCDYCGQEQTYNGLGVRPMVGVRLVDQEVVCDPIPRDANREHKDFCDEHCLLRHLQNLFQPGFRVMPDLEGQAAAMPAQPPWAMVES